jgi:hypothetical protein
LEFNCVRLPLVGKGVNLSEPEPNSQQDFSAVLAHIVIVDYFAFSAKLDFLLGCIESLVKDGKLLHKKEELLDVLRAGDALFGFHEFLYPLLKDFAKRRIEEVSCGVNIGVGLHGNIVVVAELDLDEEEVDYAQQLLA